MTASKAEQAVIIARRRAKRAPRGRKQEALLRLKLAVTAALVAAKDRDHIAGTPISMDKQRDSRMRDVFLFADDGKKTQTSGAERAAQ